MRKASLLFCSALVGAGAVGLAATAESEAPDSNQSLIERGRYVVQIGGCNDCHTPGYAEAGGNVPEQDWLTGTSLGWRGPWGTTYATNLRLSFDGLSEDEWVSHASQLETRPPMPWFTLQDMTEKDLRAMYRFVRSLGPAGEPVSEYLPPEEEPPTPYIQFPMPPAR